MGYGMSFGTGLPSNYQNGLYWQYLMQVMQQAQDMQQQRYNDAVAMLNARNAQQQQLFQPQAGQNESAAAASGQQPAGALSSSSQDYTGYQATVKGDGKDDGKISAGKKFRNFFKGVGNFFKGMVCDEKGKFSLTQTLKTVAVAAGAVVLTVATGGAAVPFLVAGGAALGAYQTGKGIYKAATAKTDAEAEAAWQEIGSGATAIAGSVAGAKGALRAAGAPIPKGNAVTSSLRAAKDCVKITGKGIYNGGRYALTHNPMKTGSAVRAYYNNTVKPNMTEAFSFKNGHRNYTAAMDEKLNANIKNIDAKIKALNEELAKAPKAERAAEINAQIAELNQQKTIQAARLNFNNSKNKSMEVIENKITEVEAKLADPATPAAERTILTAQRDNLYKMADVLDSKYKLYTQKNLKESADYIKTLKEQLKNAPEATKKALQDEIKFREQLLKGIKEQSKVEFAQHNVQRAEADIVRLKDQLRTATTDAQKESISARISRIEKAIATDKKILKNANYRVAAQAHLPQVGIAAGSFYLVNPQAQVDGALSAEDSAALAEADAYAQSQGFESAAAMQAYLNQQIQQNEAQLAQYNQSQNAAQTQAQASQYTTNPYGYNYNMNMYAPLPSMGTGLDFNSLYVSPYPQYYF